MTNPYAEPTTSVSGSPGETGASTGMGWLHAGLVCGFIAATMTTIFGVFVIPEFSKVFANFGADLPLLTRLVVNYYLLIWVVPLAVFLAWRFRPCTRRRNILAGMIGIGSSVAAVPIIVVAMYLPIFRLAGAV